MGSTTRRRLGAACADNLCIAAGFGADRTKNLRELLDEWLFDRFDALPERGYFLAILLDQKDGQVFHVYRKGSPMTAFSVEGKMLARFGAYAPFSGSGLRYLEMQSKSTALRHAPNGDEEQVDVSERQEPDAPRRAGVVINECVRERAQFDDLYDFETGQGHVGIVYYLPSGTEARIVASAGGTGLLEDYPADTGIRRRVHKRNLLVVRNCKGPYEDYLRSYQERLRLIRESLSSPPSPEARLRALGPPLSPYTFPRPAGATDREYAELMDAGACSAIDAWRAIRETLDMIWNERSAGSFWIKGGVVIDPGLQVGGLGQKFGLKGKVSFNFEATSTGELKSKSATELGVDFAGVNVEVDTEKGEIKKVGASPKVGDDAKGSVDVSDDEAGFSGTVGAITGGVKLDKDRMVAEVSTKVGPYKFKFKEDGTMTVSAGFADVAGNMRTGEVTISGEYSFKDFLLEHIPNGPDGKTPGWAQRAWDVKVTWEVGGKIGVNESDIMRIVEKTPGFWEMRPREEFIKLAWGSLDADEQACLTKLGFDLRSWDLHLLPASTQDYWTQLSPEQKSATLRLPIPTADPYWKKFWEAFGKSGPGLADLTVLVNGGDGGRRAKTVVRVEAPGVRRMLATGEHGEATFPLLPIGKYQVIASAEHGDKSSGASTEVELRRGVKAELELTVA